VPSPSTFRGLLDTSVLVALSHVDPLTLPEEAKISALSLAELAAGPHAAHTAAERAARQARLQQIEAAFSPLPFDDACARCYGLIYAATLDIGRKARGARSVDLLIAATALAHSLTLYTNNSRDFQGLSKLLPVVAVTIR
jgi:predicted nucleic acid-binding protein